MNLKSELREKYLNMRRALKDDYIIFASNIIYSNFINLPQLSNVQNVFIYSDFDNEVCTNQIYDWLFENKKNIFYPKVEGQIMIAVKRDGEFKKNKFGFLEPCNKKDAISPDLLNLIIVPGIVFDKSKNRIGYGKGYYDRYLANCKAYKIGLAYSIQIADVIFPINKLDVPLDMLITEKGIIV